MKIIKNKTVKMGVVALVLSVIAISCKPEPPEPPKPPTKGNCELKGKFTRDVCLPSIYNNFVILDEKNDRFLAPCESDVAIPQNIEEGQLVEYSYEEIPYGGECEKMIICDAIPSKPYKFVRITCITPQVSIALD